METGSDLGYRNSDRSFAYAQLNRPLTRTSPREDWSLRGVKEGAHQDWRDLKDGKFGNFQRSGWHRVVPSLSTAPANGAGLPKTRKRGKLANDAAALVNVG